MPLHTHKVFNEGQTSLLLWQILESEEWFREHLPDINMPGHPQRRLQHLAGRFLLSQALPAFPFHDIRAREHGKPYLEQGGLDFSISHSGDMAAVILSLDFQVGVDLEFISPRVLKVAARFLGFSEKKWICESYGFQSLAEISLSDFASVSLFTLLWSAKESAYKWLGIPGLDFAADLIIEPFKPGKSGQLKTRCIKDGDLSFSIGYQSLEQGWLTWVNEPLNIHRPETGNVNG